MFTCTDHAELFVSAPKCRDLVLGSYVGRTGRTYGVQSFVLTTNLISDPQCHVCSSAQAERCKVRYRVASIQVGK